MAANQNRISRMDYLGRFLDGVDFLLQGKKGSISEDRWLIRHYDPHFYDIIAKYLDHQDYRVRAEAILLLSELRERSALEKIKVLRRTDKEAVALACLSYLNRMEEADDLIPQLMEVLRNGIGDEFRKAAMKIRSSGRSEDIPALREIYGGLGDWRAPLIHEAISSIVDRTPELEKKKDLLTSKPVFPNEDAYSRFLDKAIDYIDVRYKEKIAVRRVITTSTFKNIIKALGEMRVRLYNEEENLQYYHPTDIERHRHLITLLEWAYSDLGSKELSDIEKTKTVSRCPECNTEMRFYNDKWMCMDCGYRGK